MRVRAKDFLLGASYMEAGFTQLDVLLKNGARPLTSNSTSRLHHLLAREFGIAKSEVEVLPVPVRARGPVNIFRARLPVMITIEEAMCRSERMLDKRSNKLSCLPCRPAVVKKRRRQAFVRRPGRTSSVYASA